LRLSLAVQTPDVKAAVPVALLSGSFEEKLDKAADFGFDGVELLVARPGELDPEHISKELSRRKLEVSAIGTGAVYMIDGLTLLHGEPEIRERALQRFEDLIAFAARIGAGCVTVGGFRGRAAWVKNGDSMNILIEVLRRASAHAAHRGVRIALEPLNRYETDIFSTAEETLAFLSRLERDAVGLLLDTFHVNIEEPSIAGCFTHAMEAEKLFHVHLGDSNRHPPGKGHFEFSLMIATLNDRGYEGFLSAELLPVPDADRAAEDTVRYMRGLMK
jgi:sugar phosphate isomerase/epimerase